MQDLTQADFEAATRADDRPVIVDFWAPWCGPCKMLNPVLHRIEAEAEVVVFKVDISREAALAEAWSVKATPTFVLMRNGAEVDRKVGGVPGGVLRTWALAAAGRDGA